MIPACSGPYGVLPEGRHSATLDEIKERFVVEAPYRERRELIFDALSLHTKLVSSMFSRAKLWIDGGFVTHKSWAAPEDADVAVLVPTAEYAQAIDDKSLPLWTILNVSGRMNGANIGTSKLHPMGGLLDAFWVPDSLTAQVDFWDEMWSRVRDQQGDEVVGLKKGYLEVEV